MMSQLTGSERQTAMAMCVAAVMIGLLMAVVGRSDPMGVHGWIVLIFGAVLFFIVGSAIYDPEPARGSVHLCKIDTI
jgi:cytochrome c oxidase cbb3-type subunit 1